MRRAVNNSMAHFQKFEFDDNQVDRMLNLLILKSRCLRQDTALKIEFSNFEPAVTFFWAISLSIDSLLLTQLNDEATACLDERGPMHALVEKIKEAARVKNIEIPKLAVDDLPNLLANRTEFIIGSCFLDFIVSTYSAFEMFMARIYGQLRPRYPRSGKQGKRIANLIKKYNNAILDEREEVLRSIIEEGGSYVSGAEKIEFVMSKMSPTYPRNLVKDREIIQFYANARNSIHNLGRNFSAKDLRLQINGAEISLLSGQPVFSHDRSNITRLCGELVEIYLSVVMQNSDLDAKTFIATD